MNYNEMILSILLFVLIITTLHFFITLISIFLESKKEKTIVILKCLKTHNNRTLQFTKGKEYKFYKNGDILLLNSDDLSKYRDNYSFYGVDLENNFDGTNFLSKLVLKNIKYK